MKKSTIWMLTAVMAVAVLGLLFMQIMYIENMVKMRNQQFGEAVMRSLYSVAGRLERDETEHFLDQDLNEAQRSFVPLSTSKFGDNDFSASDSTRILSLSRDNKSFGENNLSSGLNSQTRQEILKGQYLYQKSLLNEVVLNILNHASDRPIAERADSSSVREYINQELQLENARKSLYKEIQQAYYNAVAAQAKCKSSLAAAQSAEQAFVLTREKYDNGKANVTEYNDSRARYLEAQSNYLQARYEAVYQEKLLDFYRGQPLAF